MVNSFNQHSRNISTPTYVIMRKMLIHIHCIDNNYSLTFLKSLSLSGYRIHD